MNKPFDLAQAKAGKPVITRDGRPARIVCFDRKQNGFPLFGFSGESDERVYSWTLDGKYYGNGESPEDLFMAPEEKTVWVNLYRDYMGSPFAHACVFSSEQVARDNKARSQYIGTFPITYQE